MRKIIDGYFERNRIVRFLLDDAPTDMNKLWKMRDGGLFTLEEMREFYQLIGYSTEGYEEIFEKYD